MEEWHGGIIVTYLVVLVNKNFHKQNKLQKNSTSKRPNHQSKCHFDIFSKHNACNAGFFKGKSLFCFYWSTGIEMIWYMGLIKAARLTEEKKKKIEATIIGSAFM